MIKKQKIIQKVWYDVKVECMLPAVLTYKVFAENPEQASVMIKHMAPNSIKHKLIGRKNIKLLVYDAGCSMLRLILRLI